MIKTSNSIWSVRSFLKYELGKNSKIQRLKVRSLKMDGKIRMMLPVGYYALSGIIYSALSMFSSTLWFFPLGLAIAALAASYGLYSRRRWGWLISGLSSFLGIVCWGTSLYVSLRITGNPFAENAPPSANTILIMDLALAALIILSAISLIYAYMERDSFSDRR